MITQPFKFRHLDAIVGGFVIGAVVLAVTAFMLVGHARQWFTARAMVNAEMRVAEPERTDFFDDMAETLRPGTPVDLGGTTVGQVVSASQEGGRLLMELQLSRSALRGLHVQDAKLVIKVPLAPFMGQTRVILKAGRLGEAGWPVDQDGHGPSIPIEPPRDSTAMALSVLRTMEGNLQPLLTRVAGVLDETKGLLAEVRAQRLPERTAVLLDSVQSQHLPERTAALMQRGEAIAGQIETMLAGLNAGKGPAGKVLTDDKLAADLAAIAADLRAMTGQLRQATPGMAEGASNLLDQAQRLVDGLSRHWLLKGYTQPAEAQRLPPSGLLPPPPQTANAAEGKP